MFRQGFDGYTWAREHAEDILNMLKLLPGKAFVYMQWIFEAMVNLPAKEAILPQTPYP